MIPRPEFPRPDFARNQWLSLNGEWDFMMDRAGSLSDADVLANGPFDLKITVPFCYESAASGIGEWADCESIWYRRTVTVTKEQLAGAVLLKFGAVDYEAFIWVNGTYIGTHKGGHTSFAFDISHAVKAGENTLVVKAVDSLATDKPRGKQSWTGEKFGCWYTPTSGIWQSVWLEFTGREYIKSIKITPDIDTLTAECEVYLSTTAKRKVAITASFDNSPYVNVDCRVEAVAQNGFARATITLRDYDFVAFDRLFWTPEHPHLIDVNVQLLRDDSVIDAVDTYFGMRKISAQGDVIMLNNNPYYQRLILDQGYWQESLLTPPSDEAIIADINLTKAMGFNGARKHQKIEDPRYYYWADKIGLLVWGELPSSYMYNSAAVVNAQQEFSEFILRDYNHPCIVTWVPINESWGVRDIRCSNQQQDFARALTYTAKSLDKTRLISANDGWEQIDAGDICAIHDYAIFGDNTDKYDDVTKVIDRGLTGRMIYAEGNRYEGKPLIMTEYGGIAFSDTADNDWGYFGKVRSEKDFLARLEPVTDIFTKSRQYCGFCYTQLTDVMQEVNGLLTMDRKPKIAVEKLAAIFGKVWH